MQSRLAVDDHWQQATQMTARVSQAMQPKVPGIFMLDALPAAAVAVSGFETGSLSIYWFAYRETSCL